MSHIKAPMRGYWIGMYSDRNSRSFAWSDMSEVTYTRWDRHEPTAYKRQTGSCVAVFQQVSVKIYTYL